MPVYERVFDIEYPLPKLDTLIVSSFDYTNVPVLINQAADFDSGAMENWVRPPSFHRRCCLTVR
jgi:aminopeptidase 2